MAKLLVLSLCLSLLAVLAEGMFAPNDAANPNGSSNFMIKTFVGGNFSSSTSAPPSPPKPKQLYFDLTEKIDTILEDDEAGPSFLRNFTKNKKDGSKRPQPNIFYSTDLLVSDLGDISHVTDLLDGNELKDSPLFLSFRLTHEGSISEDRLADIFYSLDSSIPEEKLKSLKKHIKVIVLDIAGDSNSCPYGSSYDSYKTYNTHSPIWDIPFPKYAKKIAQKLLGGQDSSSLQVGVMYNYSQFDCFKMAEQLKQADFHIINVDFKVELFFPPTYGQFTALLEHQKQINSKMVTIMGGGNKTVMFRLNLVKPSADALLSEFIHMAEDANTIVEETQSAYFPLLVKFAKKWTDEGNSEVILSKSMDLIGGEDEVKRSFDSKNWYMPYMHVQEVDVNPCQLRTMLGHTASHYTNLAVNEYTWSAFARYENEMSSKNCPKAVDLPANPPSTYLIFTSGIGEIWNKTEEYFEKLLQNHQTISGWHLSTLVFPSRDVKRSTCASREQCQYQYDEQETPTDQGIPRFALQMKNKYKIGCLVEFGEELQGYGSMGSYKVLMTNSSCNHLMELSSVIIWQFPMQFNSMTNYEFNTRYRSFKYNLLRILMERDSFLKQFPDKEVIFQITITNADTLIHDGKEEMHNYYGVQNTTCGNKWVMELQEFYNGIQAWAGIHGVKVIISPAYHPEEPAAGLWMLPEDDGSPIKLQSSECTFKANYW